MRLSDIGAAVQEVMESYEVEIGGKTYQGKKKIIRIRLERERELAGRSQGGRQMEHFPLTKRTILIPPSLSPL